MAVVQGGSTWRVELDAAWQRGFSVNQVGGTGWRNPFRPGATSALSWQSGSVRARANKYRLSWDEPIQGHAACKMASTVTVFRRWCQRALNAPQFGACKIPHLAGPAISREFDGQLHVWVVDRAAGAAA